MKNMNYGKSLAKGLCYLDTGLDVFLAESLEEGINEATSGVLLTDCETNENPKIIRLSNRDKKKPLNAIHEKIRCAFRNVYNAEIGSIDSARPTVFGVYSKNGGKGVTSLAITLSRLMSVKTNKNILYLSMDKIDDSKKYIGFCGIEKLSKQQYVFMNEEGLSSNLMDYLCEDQWGVHYFVPDIGTNFFETKYAKDSVLEYVESENFFNYIIVDFGKIYGIDNKKIHKKIEIVEEKVLQDLSRKSVEDTLKVINFSDYIKDGEGYFYIKKDEYSFNESDEVVEISMDGKYAKSVEKLIDDNNLAWMT